MDNYKYKPADFKHCLLLSDDMTAYYTAIVRFNAKEITKWALQSAKEDLYFSVKHRLVEGDLSPTQGAEMREYFDDLYIEAIEND